MGAAASGFVCHFGVPDVGAQLGATKSNSYAITV